MSKKQKKTIKKLRAICKECVPVIQTNITRLDRLYPDSYVTAMMNCNHTLLDRLNKVQLK